MIHFMGCAFHVNCKKEQLLLKPSFPKGGLPITGEPSALSQPGRSEAPWSSDSQDDE